MAFGAGQLIEDIDYTTVYNKILAVYGRTDDGYGQLMNSNPVADGVIVYASHWDSLRTYIINSRIHQIGTATLTDVDVTSIISYTHLSSYNTMAENCSSDKRLVANGQFTPDELKTSGTRQSSVSGTWGQQSASNQVLTASFTVTGADMNSDGSRRGLRYFFNAGGKVKFNLSLAGFTIAADPSGQGKGQKWADLFSGAGTIAIDYTQTTCSGSGTTTGIGALELSTTDSTIFTKTVGSGVYSENYFRIFARFSDSSETSIVFTIKCYDLDTGDQRTGILPGPAEDEAVDGNLTVAISQDRPSGSYVSVSSPSYSAISFSTGTA
jgi:hypothetical protein